METLTVRLSTEEAAKLRELTRRSGRSKSDIVRELIRESRAGGKNGKAVQTAYDRVKHLIGIWHSGEPNLSQRTGERFYEMLMEEKKKRDARGRRTTGRAHQRRRPVE